MPAHLTAGAVQQVPPQDPRRADTPNASAPPAPSGSAQQDPPQDPRKLQAPNLAVPSASAAPAGRQSAESSTRSRSGERPKDPRPTAGAHHTQHHLRIERQPQSSLVQQTVQADEEGLPGLDDAHASLAEMPPASRLSTQLSDLDGDEALLYGSEPDLIPSATQARHAGEPLREGQHPRAWEQATFDSPEEQLLYDDPLMLAEGDHSAAKPPKSARLDSNDGTAEVAIPGLDPSQSPDNAMQLSMSVSTDGLRSGSVSQHPSVDRQQIAPSTRLNSRHTEPSAACIEQIDVSHSASTLPSHLSVGSADVHVLDVGRSSVEQGPQRPTMAPKPITLPAPSRLGRVQRPHEAVPQPITLKPPAHARQGGGGFKPHTTDYKR